MVIKRFGNLPALVSLSNPSSLIIIIIIFQRLLENLLPSFQALYLTVLSRTDLSPKGPEDDDVQSLWPTLTRQSTGQNNIRHTVMEERLREVRGLQIPENAEAEAEAEAGETRRRNRLSQRIVDRLRIRTARHGEEFFP